MFGVFGLSMFRSKDQIQKLKIPTVPYMPYKTGKSSRPRRQKQYFFTENYKVEQQDKPDVFAQFQKNRTSKILMHGSKLKLFRIESSFEKKK